MLAETILTRLAGQMNYCDLGQAEPAGRLKTVPELRGSERPGWPTAGNADQKSCRHGGVLASCFARRGALLNWQRYGSRHDPFGKVR